MTVTNADGSTTATTTKTGGTTTVVTTSADGNTVTTVVKDASGNETSTSTAVTTTNENGTTTTTTTITDSEGNKSTTTTETKEDGTKVTKDEKGEVISTFTPQEVSATATQLNLAPASVVSNNEKVAKAELSDDRVNITSVGEGNAVITVRDSANHTATVAVTVDKTGEFTAKQITPYSETPSQTQDDNTVTPGGQDATGTQEAPAAADVSNATVEIVESSGWLNSAYVIFKQVEDATYKVLIDDKELDEPLIRYYDTYTYYEQSEDENLQVTWTKKTLSKVVRADALGLAKGSHTMKVAAVSGDTTSAYSTATMTVVDHDRSGFAFAPEATTTPGAYKADGTLKDNAIVIYLTQGNKKTLTATIGGKSYTGIQDITQAIKTKNTGTTPIDIRIVGAVKAESKDLSCSDMSSAYALGVKGASNVTIEGVGHDASLIGAGVAAFQSEAVEISNLGLIKWGGGKDGDGVSLKADSYVWVHNCDFFYGDAGSDADQAKGDGSMDLKDDSNHVTISYNHFWDSGKMSLCGMKSESGENWITYHHNWFDHSDSRHPRIRTMTVHVYNNYFDGNSRQAVKYNSPLKKVSNLLL